MVNLTFVSVGTLKEGYLKEACAEYSHDHRPCRWLAIAPLGRNTGSVSL